MDSKVVIMDWVQIILMIFQVEQLQWMSERGIDQLWVVNSKSQLMITTLKYHNLLNLLVSLNPLFRYTIYCDMYYCLCHLLSVD